MESLEDVKKELEAKHEQLSIELESARGKMAAIEADLQRVDEALGALTNSKKGKARARSKKSAPTVDEIRKVLAAVREQFPFVEGQELAEAVRSQLKKRGGSLSGFEALYAEALTGPRSPFGQDRFGHGIGRAQDPERHSA